MSPPLVSVCIPTYNGADYLTECLDSVVAQTYGDLEILIVDDASHDATVGIVGDYARRDRRIRLVRNERNLGLVGNWNKSIALAGGTWIKFLFQDDLLAPECVQRLLAHAIGTGIPMAACHRDFLFEGAVDEDTRSLYRLHRGLVDEWVPGPSIAPDALADLALRYMPRNFIGEPTVTLLETSLLRRLGPFNADLIQLCDAEYWLRAGLVAGIAMVREPLATFRVHAASTTSRNKALRDFRMRVLDVVVIRHEYLFSPRYSALRDRARARGMWRNLVDAFWETVHYGHQEAEHHAVRGDPAPLREWHALCARYPRIAGVPMVHQLRRKGRRVLELVTQRSGSPD